MVAAVSTAEAAPSSTILVPKDPSVVTRPLIPSDRGNAGVSRRPRTKEITSRYLSSHSSFSSSTTSTSYASNTTISSSSSRRCASPLPIHRPSTPSTFTQRTAKRSQSVDRVRPSSPCPDPLRGGPTAAVARSNAARSLCTTTRSLSVSFQGEPFFYHTSKGKAASHIPTPKPTLYRQRPSTPAKTSTARIPDQSENSKPRDHHHRWPAAISRQSNLLTRSLDSSSGRNDVLVTAHMLRQSMFFDNGSGRTSFDGAEFSTSSDTDSVSSGSISATPNLNEPRHSRATSHGIIVPGRFLQDTDSRLCRQQEPGTPSSSFGPRSSATPKEAFPRRSLVENPLSAPRPSSSPLRGPLRPSSPSKLAAFPSKGTTNPSRARDSRAIASSIRASLTVNAPSIISFAAEVRRSKKGENRIEEAHMLTLFHNQHLQWRCVNARVNVALMVQRVATEKNLCNAWIKISEVRDLVTIKKIKLQFLMQHLKLTTILKGQMVHLEELSLLDREHSSSLSGAIEALMASTLRLPVVSGARVDLKEVKDAAGSAADVMQGMGASMYSLMSKVEVTSSLISEIAGVSTQERALLNQSRNLLATVEALHVKHCSLRSHLIQLKCRTSQI